MEIRLPLMCRSKKNSQRIVFNRNTKRPMIIQSEIYKKFERECGKFLKRNKNNIISYPINLKCLFYVPDKKKRDL